MKIITLTTDFGALDGYVGAVKGVILGIAPSVQLVDLSHDVPPHDVRHAIYVLANAVRFFPTGAIHLAVVDPGVGSERRPLLVTTSGAAFVGPDNGLFTFALEEPGAQAWELDQPAYWLTNVSRTFHGRDIFAPVAAHLSNGVLPQQLGRPIASPVRLPVSVPRRRGDDGIVGNVIHIDRFGNLITDVPAAWVVDGEWVCEIASRRIDGLADSYAAARPGELLAVVSGSGTVEIAVREGSAARTLGVGPGAIIEVWRKGAFNGEVHHRGRSSPER